MNEKTLSNNPFFRKISDKLDNQFGWVGEDQEKSRIRGALHGLYHFTVGTAKMLYKNKEGAQCEFDRALIQFRRMKNGDNTSNKDTKDEKEKEKTSVK